MGKWGCNNGQACVAPDYILTTKSFAPTLVAVLVWKLMSSCILFILIIISLLTFTGGCYEKNFGEILREGSIGIA